MVFVRKHRKVTTLKGGALKSSAAGLAAARARKAAYDLSYIRQPPLLALVPDTNTVLRLRVYIYIHSTTAEDRKQHPLLF